MIQQQAKVLRKIIWLYSNYEKNMINIVIDKICYCKLFNKSNGKPEPSRAS